MNVKNVKLFIGDESIEITSYQIGVDPAFGEDESIGVWRARLPDPIDLTIDFNTADIEVLYEVLFGRPFYRYPKWVMQAVLLLSFVILVMVLS